MYGFGQKAIVFLLDKNLDKHHDGIDTYRPRSGFVFLEIAGKRMPGYYCIWYNAKFCSYRE